MPSTMSPLAGRTTLVAGGTGHVGRHLVHGLLGAGATVIVPSRSRERLDQLRTTIGSDRRDRFVPIIGDIGDERDAPRVRDEARARTGSLHGAVASLGKWIAAPSLLAAPRKDFVQALDDYLLAHFVAARTLIPALADVGGSYTLINGPLAFVTDAGAFRQFPGAALVSVATSGQAMLARALMSETANGHVRVNELVIYAGFGWGADDQGPLKGEHIGRYVAHLISDRGAAIKGRTIHLKSPGQLED